MCSVDVFGVVYLVLLIKQHPLNKSELFSHFSVFGGPVRCVQWTCSVCSVDLFNVFIGHLLLPVQQVLSIANNSNPHSKDMQLVHTTFRYSVVQCLLQ
jgi:hypothetical protein